MKDLIKQLEEASGPDRAIDAAIFDRLGRVDEKHCASWRRMDGRTDLTREMYVKAWAPDYTSSLDAALTVVPDNMWWLVGCGQLKPTEPLYGAQIRRPGFSTGGEIVTEAEHGCMAIALCIAALQAREPQSPPIGEKS